MTSERASSAACRDSAATSRIVVRMDQPEPEGEVRFHAVSRRLVAEESFPQPGDPFLHFTIVEELGRGGFARAYLAKQNSLSNRLVVVKVSSMASDEPQKLARLQHANIVPVYSVHDVEGLEAICMPYLGRLTLHRILMDHGDERGRFDFRRFLAHSSTPEPMRRLAAMSHIECSLWFVSQLAAGLAHSHGRGILHRDLKPANILLTDDGVPMLLDFNVSSDSGGGHDRIGGTFEYMAPEHLAAFDGADTQVDERSDLYSLGALLYELLTGRLPHPPNPAECTGRVMHGAMIEARQTPPPHASTLNPLVPAGVDAMLLKLLAPRPDDRYRTADDLHDDLTRQLADRPLRHVRERSVRERARKWRRRNPRLATGLLVGTIALFALVLPAASIAADKARERTRAAELQQAEARVQFQEAMAAMPEIGVMLASRNDPALREQGAARAKALLHRFEVPSNAEWEARPEFARLDSSQKRTLKEAFGELLILLTRVELLKGQREAAREWNGLAAVMFVDAPAVVARHTAEIAQGPEPDAKPRDGWDWYFDGLDLVTTGRCREALPLLVKSCALRPGHLESWFARGVCHDALNQPLDAVAAFSACIALQSEYPYAHLNRGIALLKARRAAEAISDFTRALELKPYWLPALINRGLAWDQLAKHRDAEADFTAALADPAVPTRVWFQRARSRRFLRDEAGYAADKAEGMKREPTDGASFRTRATWHRFDRQFTAAIADFDAALKLNAADTDALLNKGIILADDLHREAEAIPLFDKLVALAPEHVDARCSRGVYHARLGHAVEARRDAADSLKVDSSAYRLFQVAGIHAQLSKTDPGAKAEAIRHLARALRAGFRDSQLLKSDRDLDPIRVEPEVVKLLSSVNQVEEFGK